MRSLIHVLFAALLGWITTAAAQGTVGVDPVARLFTSAPGQTITQVLNIYNPNPTGLRLRVAAYLSDMNISEVGETTYLPAGTLKESLAAWTTFNPAELDLGPQETKQVRYTVQVPADATPGTHWAMLMFEGQDPNPVPGKTLATFRLRVAHTMYVNVQPTRLQGEITGIFENPPKKDTDYYQMGVQYANTGNAATGVQGRVELRDTKGELVATLPIPLTVALPGRTVLLRVAWSGPIPKGQYSALVVLQDGDRSRDLLGEHVVKLPFDLKEHQQAAPAPPAPPPPAQPGGSAAPGSGGKP